MSTSKSTPILLLIDLQEGLVSGAPSEGPRSTPNLTTNVSILLKLFRSRKWPILHVQHDDIDNEDNNISARFPESFAFHSCAKPMDGEKVFVKHTGSAFIRTELADTLNILEAEQTFRKGISKVIIAGMDGRECVNSTVRHGSDLGFEMTVVWDACASYGLRGLDGEMIDAETVHRMGMAMLGSYSRVENLETVMREMEEK